MKRTTSLILVLVLLFSSMLGVISFAEAETEENVGELKISAANLEFGSNIYLMVAVDYSELYDSYDAAAAAVTVVITDRDGKETRLMPDSSVKDTTGFPDNSVGFKYTKLGAKNIADQLTIQALNNGSASGASKTYSILEYAVTAKTERSDNLALCAAVDAMLEFGAEAQKAFNYTGDYALYDSDGYIDFGMLIVYGGAPKKVFGKLGSTVTPTASTDVGTGAVLYNTAYEEMANNKVTVKEGIQKFFFVGSENITPYSLDTDWYTGAATTAPFNYENWTKTSNSSMSKEFNLNCNTASRTLALTVSKTNNESTMWCVSGGTNSKNLVVLTDNVVTKYYDHGIRELGNGYLYINTAATKTYADMLADVADGTVGEYTGITGVTENLNPTSAGYNFNYSGLKASDMLDESGKLTATFTLKLAKDADGNALGFFNAFRFRKQNPNVYLNFFNNTQSLKGKITLTGTEYIQLSTEEWTTFHVVLDSTTGVMTLYNSNGEVVETVVNSTLTPAYLDVAYINWNIGGNQAGYINKILFTKGNIFE